MLVSVILPTLNERASLDTVAPRLESAFGTRPVEFLVVDDASTDGTIEFVAGRSGRGWRLLERPSRRGLASAVVDGIAAARGGVLVVMDADGSHPPERAPDLADPILAGRAEFVLASRAVPGGSDAGLRGARRLLSWGASALARPLVRVTDPMSGFFAFDRRILPGRPLDPLGYKIGLEILVRCRPGRVLEVPYQFAPRVAGESKLGAGQILDYVRHLGRLYGYRSYRRERLRTTRSPPREPAQTAK